MAKKPTCQELREKIHSLEKIIEKTKSSPHPGDEIKNMQQLLKIAPYGMFLIDLSGKIIQCNEKGAERLGASPDKISGTLLRNYFPPDISKNRQLKGFQSVESGEPVTFEDQVGDKHYYNTIYPIFNDMGKIDKLAIYSTDISDIIKSENKLRESEEKYRTILNNIEEGYYEVDLSGRLTFFNDSMQKILGYDKDDLIGMIYRDYMDAENAVKVFKVFNTVYTTGEGSKRYDYVLKDKDGSPHFVEASVTLMTDVHGTPSGFRGIVRDVTDRKKAEHALRESEEKYRTILDTMLDGYIESNLHGNNIFINRSAHEMMGYTREEYLGMNYKEYTTPENAKKLFETYHQVFRTGEPAKLTEYKLVTKDRRSLTLEASVTLMRDESGNPIGFRALIRDITEKKRSEEKLKQSLQTSDDIVKSIPSGLWIYQFVEPDRLFLMDGNPEAEKLSGVKKKDWIGKEFNEIWSEAKKNGITELFLSPMKTGEMFETEELHYKDQHIEGAFRIRAFKMPGSRLGVAFENITEKKKLEAQFYQAQKMEAVGTLAGGIAHDFNNLLMGVLGRCSLMMTDLASSHTHFKHLTEIETYVKSAVDLTAQLLGFARGGRYEVVPTDINLLIQKHNRMFGRTKKEISIKGKYEEKVWPVEVDRGQIEQVLMNMYINAWQAMPDGGDLFVHTENLKLDRDYTRLFEASPGKYVRISITDTGFGMTKEIKDKIFDPFFTTKEKQRGTGMGLSSAYGIIRNHRGFISVYSEPGEGTTFNIYIPASKKRVHKEKRIEKKMVKGSGTVLLIDDEELVTNVGEKLLKKLGYDVLTAPDGKEGVNLYKNKFGAIDIIILDLIMPGMSGKETCEALIGINPDAKILLASGYSLNGKAREMLDLGCSGFIQKPFNLQQLSVKINEILNQ